MFAIMYIIPSYNERLLRSNIIKTDTVTVDISNKTKILNKSPDMNTPIRVASHTNKRNQKSFEFCLPKLYSEAIKKTKQASSTKTAESASTLNTIPITLA
jgi:hypothetical protein